MKKILLFTFFLSAFAMAEDDPLCFETPYIQNEISNLNQIISKNYKQPYYLYFSGDKIEDLQTVKNCLDYGKCGKASESVVDDPKNYRLHIWTKFTKEELEDFINTCPVPNLAKKLAIHESDQKGRRINFSPNSKGVALSNSFKDRANPAIFKHISVADANAAVKKISLLLKEQKAAEANELILKTWNINIHDYSISYTGKSGGFATANHQSKKIEYSSDWFKNPCDFIRMIRHEAEHVAQMRQVKLCGGDHNFSDHKMRERAAHLNDALFIPTVCPNTNEAKSIRDFCVKRFKTNYFND